MANIKQRLAAIGMGFALLGIMLATPIRADAVFQPPGGSTCAGGVGNFLGLQNWDACLPKDAKGVPQFSDLNDVWKVAVVLIEDFLKIAGYLAVGYFIWGSFKYVKSQGEPGETTQARQIITNAMMGLVIVLISVAIVQFVAGTFK